MPRRSCGAAARRAGKALRGELAIQPLLRRTPAAAAGAAGAGELERTDPAGPERGTRSWPSGQGQEVKRLAGQARSALQQRGVVGLAREVLNYVQWQLACSAGNDWANVWTKDSFRHT